MKELDKKKVWRFHPNDPTNSYQPRRRRKFIPKEGWDWRAPEHIGMTKDMKRDYPRNDRGEPIRGFKPEFLVINLQPNILVGK